MSLVDINKNFKFADLTSVGSPQGEYDKILSTGLDNAALHIPGGPDKMNFYAQTATDVDRQSMIDVLTIYNKEKARLLKIDNTSTELRRLLKKIYKNYNKPQYDRRIQGGGNTEEFLHDMDDLLSKVNATQELKTSPSQSSVENKQKEEQVAKETESTCKNIIEKVEIILATLDKIGTKEENETNINKKFKELKTELITLQSKIDNIKLPISATPDNSALKHFIESTIAGLSTKITSNEQKIEQILEALQKLKTERLEKEEEHGTNLITKLVKDEAFIDLIRRIAVSAGPGIDKSTKQGWNVFGRQTRKNRTKNIYRRRHGGDYSSNEEVIPHISRSTIRKSIKRVLRGGWLHHVLNAASFVVPGGLPVKVGLKVFQHAAPHLINFAKNKLSQNPMLQQAIQNPALQSQVQQYIPQQLRPFTNMIQDIQQSPPWQQQYPSYPQYQQQYPSYYGGDTSSDTTNYSNSDSDESNNNEQYGGNVTWAHNNHTGDVCTIEEEAIDYQNISPVTEYTVNKWAREHPGQDPQPCTVYNYDPQGRQQTNATAALSTGVAMNPYETQMQNQWGQAAREAQNLQAAQNQWGQAQREAQNLQSAQNQWGQAAQTAQNLQAAQNQWGQATQTAQNLQAAQNQWRQAAREAQNLQAAQNQWGQAAREAQNLQAAQNQWGQATQTAQKLALKNAISQGLVRLSGPLKELYDAIKEYGKGQSNAIKFMVNTFVNLMQQDPDRICALIATVLIIAGGAAIMLNANKNDQENFLKNLLQNFKKNLNNTKEKLIEISPKGLQNFLAKIGIESSKETTNNWSKYAIGATTLTATGIATKALASKIIRKNFQWEEAAKQEELEKYIKSKYGEENLDIIKSLVDTVIEDVITNPEFQNLESNKTYKTAAEMYNATNTNEELKQKLDNLIENELQSNITDYEGFDKLKEQTGGNLSIPFIQFGGVDIKRDLRDKMNYYDNLKTDKEKYQLIESLNEDPIYSQQTTEIATIDRTIFIVGTYIIRTIVLLMIEWGINSHMITTFKQSFQAYIGGYIALFLVWVGLANINENEYQENIVLSSLFYYINARANKLTKVRILIHIFVQISLLPLLFIIKYKSSEIDQDSFEQRKQLYDAISQFTFFIWLMTSIIASRF